MYNGINLNCTGFIPFMLQPNKVTAATASTIMMAFNQFLYVIISEIRIVFFFIFIKYIEKSLSCISYSHNLSHFRKHLVINFNIAIVAHSNSIADSQ